ncbi:MAG: hypothetical protein B7Z54_08285 [Sphingobacteriales bacterium 12-47-4]|nr:MAG: hypothetical protein B7Z54_08285 [Sphingobacteriales bacterium 12-47-4]
MHHKRVRCAALQPRHLRGAAPWRGSLDDVRSALIKRAVERFLIGEPKNWDDSDTHATPLVEQCIKDLEKNFPQIPITRVDERYTSKMAKDAMLEMGMKKKDRRKKGLVDEIAATIMLQEYLTKI